MVDFRPALVEQVQQGLCNITSSAGLTAQLGERFYDSIGVRGLSQASGDAAQLWSNASGIFCNRVPQDMSSLVAPPFTGGQCVGGQYQVTVQGTVSSPGQSDFTSSVQVYNGVGPVSQDVFSTELSGGLRVVFGDGTQFNVVSRSVPTPEDGPVTTTVDQFDVVRTDGQPDDCGDPPASGPEYDPSNFTLPVNVNFDDEGGSPQSLPVTLVYRPVRRRPDGGFSVPVEVNFNDGSQLFGDFNLDVGDIVFGPPGGGEDGDGPDDENEELPPEEDPQEQNVCVTGVRVSSVVDPDVADVDEILQTGGNPNIWVPRLGYVNFKYETSPGVFVWGPDIPVKNLEFVAWAERPAVDAAWSPEKGVEFTARIVFRTEPCCESCC